MTLFLITLLRVGVSYWSEECNGGYVPYALPDNIELDCALRALTLERSLDLLGKANLRPDTSQLIQRALNMDVCNGTAMPRMPVVRSAPTAQQQRAGIFVDARGGNDTAGDGSQDAPLRTLRAAQRAVRAALQGSDVKRETPLHVWLREGSYYEPLRLSSADSGLSAAAPVVWASHPGERAIISGGIDLTGMLEWEAVPGGTTSGAHPSAPTFKAELPAALAAKFKGVRPFSGLFGNGRRLTRARYPNCLDIAGTNCFTLNASGATPGGPTAPQHAYSDEAWSAGGVNVEVANQHGVDMFADGWDNAQAVGPHGATDASHAALGKNISLVVEHPDYAWRCHEDCGWVAYSKWRGMVSEWECNISSAHALCRHECVVLLHNCIRIRACVPHSHPFPFPFPFSFAQPDVQPPVLESASERRLLLQRNGAREVVGPRVDAPQLGGSEQRRRAHVPLFTLGRMELRARDTQRY
tara:strand:+ start:105 stop:1511 length:1407 start_codon:yes stop_codon:yes gene_type:complete